MAIRKSVRKLNARLAAIAATPALLGTIAVAQDRADGSSIALDTITVDGQRTDGRDTYLRPNSGSATKTQTPVLETPQSITVITRRQLDDQNPQTVGNALRYTAGVLSEIDATTRYDSLFIRGFGGFGTSTDYVSFLDGLKLPRGQGFATQQIDPFLLDRVEVIKGPSALLYGQISPGGLVNQISRQPSTVPYNEWRVEAGSYGRVQSGVTSQGAIDKDGRWSYSLSAIGRLSGTRYNGVDEQRIGVAPALTWRPTADTRLTLSGYYQRDPEGGYFNSLYARSLAPTFASLLNRKLNVGDPTFDHFKREQYGIGYSFEHRFNPFVSVHSSLRYSGVETDMQSLQMSSLAITPAGLLPRHAVGSIENASGLSTDNHAKFDFQTWGIGHTVLAGIDYQNSRSSWNYRYGAASSLNLLAPVYGLPVGPFMTLINNRQTLSQTGIYLQDQVRFGGFHLTLGVRHDWTEQKTDNHLTVSSQSQSSQKTSYRAGLLYLFDNGLAPYASYSTSFEPVVGVDANGAAFKPKDAEQFEVGVKYQPTFINALFTLSAFDIRQKNVLTPGAVPGFNVQQGEIRSRGLEFEARGQVIDNLEVIGALTLLDTTVTRSTTLSIIGNRPQAVPTYFGSLWANYKVTSGAFNGLTIGGGIRFVGASFADDANTIKSAAYTVVDAALRFDLAALHPTLKGAEATLNVTNLFDKDYYTSCSYNLYCQFGSGRQILAGLRYRW
jgi:iron complex outermembrane receptor protein